MDYSSNWIFHLEKKVRSLLDILEHIDTYSHSLNAIYKNPFCGKKKKLVVPEESYTYVIFAKMNMKNTVNIFVQCWSLGIVTSEVKYLKMKNRFKKIEM